MAGDVLKAGAGIAASEIESHQAGEAEAKTASEEHSRFEAAKQADAQAATAIARAIVSSATSSSTAERDRTSAEKAFNDAMATHANLSADSDTMRATFARAQLAQARARSTAAPTDGYKKALVDGWQKVVTGSMDGAASLRAGDPSMRTRESWFTRRVWGPVPGYGVLVGGGGILAGIGYVITRFLRRG